MKFGKYFLSEMVPEWHEAYLDYNHLKSLLEDVRLSNLSKRPATTTATPRSLKKRPLYFRAFSGLTERNTTTTTELNNSSREEVDVDLEEPAVILVNVVKPKGSEGIYETMFLMSTEEGGENELKFFRKLDDELNKVNAFYKTKVEEVVNEATILNKQMDALIAFRIKVEHVDSKFDFSAEMNNLASDVAASAAVVSATTPRGARAAGTFPWDVIDENETSAEEKSKDSDDILNRVKMNNRSETPYSTIISILNVDKDNELRFRKDNLKKVEQQLKLVFIEFYQKLRLLKNYSFLNLSALSKILKKYDKASSRNVAKSYLSKIDDLYIGNSDEVTRLIERVETTFIKHFAKSNRSKGMNTLRPKAKRERHRTTFSFGFLTGCTFALLVALVLIIHVRNILKEEGFLQYMENMFPLYSLFGFIILHMIMYAGNIYFWRRYRVNYSFIFGFKQGTELGYREVFLLSAGLSTLAFASVLANLDMDINQETNSFNTVKELIPLGLVTLILVITFCPFNIIYRSSRFFLLCCVFRCIAAPLYKVTLPDFFLADQLTSQIQAFRSLEFYICYYGWGDFTQRRNMCRSSDVYNTFYFIVAAIPYWSRLLQCIRRLCEEKDPMHGYNALKYFSTVLAVLVRTAYNWRGGQVLWILALLTSIVATVFSTYWDLIVDWGLLQRKSKNRWLRDKLILPHKSVYFGVMVLNILLRLAWLQTVLNVQVFSLHRETLIAIVASLEIIRRGIWNFFRLENEHLNNVGKYRAFKSLPLPFSYAEIEDRDE